MILFYVRHGDPIYDPDSLTELGKRQAEAVAKRLALYGIDRIFASTSNRAIMTAQPTSEITKRSVTQLDFCNENYAWSDFARTNDKGVCTWPFHNSHLVRIFAREDVKRLGSKWYEHEELSEYDFKSGVERIDRDTDAWLLTLGYEHDRENGIYRVKASNDERIALFAHQGFGLAFLSSLLDIPYPQFCTHFDMSHTGVTVINFAEKDGIAVPQALTVANDSHLYSEGLPTYYNNFLRF